MSYQVLTVVPSSLQRLAFAFWVFALDLAVHQCLFRGNLVTQSRTKCRSLVS